MHPGRRHDRRHAAADRADHPAVTSTSSDALRGTGREFEAVIATVIGGTLLTGGCGSAVGPAPGALIFGMVRQGTVMAGVDSDWYKASLGVMCDPGRRARQLHPRAGGRAQMRRRGAAAPPVPEPSLSGLHQAREAHFASPHRVWPFRRHDARRADQVVRRELAELGHDLRQQVGAP